MSKKRSIEEFDSSQTPISAEKRVKSTSMDCDGMDLTALAEKNNIELPQDFSKRKLCDLLNRIQDHGRDDPKVKKLIESFRLQRLNQLEVKRLLESSVSDITKKKLKSVNLAAFRDALTQEKVPVEQNVYEIVEKTDPTEKKTYVAWIVISFSYGGIRRFEDLLSRTLPALQNYEYLLRSNLLEGTLLGSKNQEKDINSFCGIAGCTKKFKEFPGLEDLIDSYQSKLEQKRQSEKDIDALKVKETEEIFSGKTLTVVEPKTERSSCYYGAGTRWCTAAQNHNMFDVYRKSGPLYIVLPKKPKYENEKYQFHFDFVDENDIYQAEGQFMDRNDEKIDFDKLVEQYPEIVDVFVELYETGKINIQPQGSWLLNLNVDNPIVYALSEEIAELYESEELEIDSNNYWITRLGENHPVMKNLSQNGTNFLDQNADYFVRNSGWNYLHDINNYPNVVKAVVKGYRSGEIPIEKFNYQVLSDETFAKELVDENDISYVEKNLDTIIKDRKWSIVAEFGQKGEQLLADAFAKGKIPIYSEDWWILKHKNVLDKMKPTISELFKTSLDEKQALGALYHFFALKNKPMFQAVLRRDDGFRLVRKIDGNDLLDENQSRATFKQDAKKAFQRFVNYYIENAPLQHLENPDQMLETISVFVWQLPRWNVSEIEELKNKLILSVMNRIVKHQELPIDRKRNLLQKYVELKKDNKFLFRKPNIILELLRILATVDSLESIGSLIVKTEQVKNRLYKSLFSPNYTRTAPELTEYPVDLADTSLFSSDDEKDSIPDIKVYSEEEMEQHREENREALQKWQSDKKIIRWLRPDAEIFE